MQRMFASAMILWLAAIGAANAQTDPAQANPQPAPATESTVPAAPPAITLQSVAASDPLSVPTSTVPTTIALPSPVPHRKPPSAAPRRRSIRRPPCNCRVKPAIVRRRRRIQRRRHRRRLRPTHRARLRSRQRPGKRAWAACSEAPRGVAVRRCSRHRGNAADQAIDRRAQGRLRIRRTGAAAPGDIAVRPDQHRAIGIDAVDLVPVAVGIAEFATAPMVWAISGGQDAPIPAPPAASHRRRGRPAARSAGRTGRWSRSARCRA